MIDIKSGESALPDIAYEVRETRLKKKLGANGINAFAVAVIISPVGEDTQPGRVSFVCIPTEALQWKAPSLSFCLFHNDF